MQHHGTLVPLMLLSKGKTSLFLSGPSKRRGRAPAALSQGVSVTSKPAVSLRDAFLVRTKQSVAVSQREGGRAGGVTCFTATVAALLKLKTEDSAGACAGAEGPQEPLTKRVSLPAHRELLEEWWLG